MLTFFSTAKPFRGHSGIIQRNAIQSWKALHPDIEIILFGDDEGAAEVCFEVSLRHEPHVERNEFGTNRIDYMFNKAQEIAHYDVLCFLNCDIILLQDFCCAIEQVKAAHPQFLAIGRRWDTPITTAIDFSSANWHEEARRKALGSGRRQTEWFIDYFAFSRGFFGREMPPLAVGRIYWDNWTVWKGCQSGKPVVDLSPVVVAIHQNHDYSHHPLGKQGVWGGQEAERNFQLAGGWDHLRNISHATEILWPHGLRPNRKRYWSAFSRTVGRIIRCNLLDPAWFFFLRVTRTLRHAVGLKSGSFRRSREKL
jgi:hypothetical protein